MTKVSSVYLNIIDNQGNKLMDMKSLAKLFLSVLILFANTPLFAQTKYQKDFKELWSDINENYAYLAQQHIDWQKVKEIYEPGSEKISSDKEFIQFLENVLHELYNGHVSLNTNLKTSNRLIPSGSDLYIEKLGDKFIIKDLRKGFGADASGLKIGMEVTMFNGGSIDEQLGRFLPKFTSEYTPQMYQYAIDMLFAGTHDTKRAITIIENGKAKTFYPVNYESGND